MADEELDWLQKEEGRRFEMKLCCGSQRIEGKYSCCFEELQVGELTGTDVLGGSLRALLVPTVDCLPQGVQGEC